MKLAKYFTYNVSWIFNQLVILWYIAALFLTPEDGFCKFALYFFMGLELFLICMEKFISSDRASLLKYFFHTHKMHHEFRSKYFYVNQIFSVIIMTGLFFLGSYIYAVIYGFCKLVLGEGIANQHSELEKEYKELLLKEQEAIAAGKEVEIFVDEDIDNETIRVSLCELRNKEVKKDIDVDKTEEKV
jgi:hypothetical protein